MIKKPNFLFFHFSFALAAILLLNPIVANAGFDESLPYSSEDVAQQYLEDHEYMDLDAYISESPHWQFGEEYEENGKTYKTATMAEKYKYKKYTGEIGYTENDIEKGDLVFDLTDTDNINNYDNTPYTCTKVRGEVGSYVSTGMHIFYYTPYCLRLVQ